MSASKRYFQARLSFGTSLGGRQEKELTISGNFIQVKKEDQEQVWNKQLVAKKI